MFISPLFTDALLQRNVSTSHLKNSLCVNHVACLPHSCRFLHIRTHCPPGQSDDQSVLFLFSSMATSRNICMKCGCPIRTHTEGLVWAARRNSKKRPAPVEEHLQVQTPSLCRRQENYSQGSGDRGHQPDLLSAPTAHPCDAEDVVYLCRPPSCFPRSGLHLFGFLSFLLHPPLFLLSCLASSAGAVC